MFLCQSAGQSVSPASTRTFARAAEQDTTFTWASARRAVLRAWSAATHRGSALVSALTLCWWETMRIKFFPNPLFILVYLAWLARINMFIFVLAGCPADCALCVNSETCTQCQPGFYLLDGRCFHICPDDYEPNDKLMECKLQGQQCFFCVCVSCRMTETPIGNFKKDK